MTRIKGIVVGLAFVLVSCGPFGFLGDPGSLSIIDGPEDSLPTCTVWNPIGFLQVVCSTTISNVWIKGGLYAGGTVDVVIHDSIIEGGAKWFTYYQYGGTLLAEYSTFRWPLDSTPPHNGNGVIHPGVGGVQITLRHVDISRGADAIQINRDSTLENVYIHDLYGQGSPPNNTHNDCIQVYAGTVVIRNSIMRGNSEFPWANACIFTQPPGGNYIDITVENSLIDGGGYILRGEGPAAWRVKNVMLGPNYLWGTHYMQEDVDVTEWSVVDMQFQSIVL